MNTQKTKRPWWRKKRYYVLALFLGFYLYAYQFLEFRMSDAELRQVLSQNDLQLQPEIRYQKTSLGRRLRTVQIGRDSLPLIVFIHGAPSSSSFWVDLLNNHALLSQAKLMAVDRPGYGSSGYGRPELSVARQAAMIAELIRPLRALHPAIILHGSSYGGTVAARLAMDFPDLVDGILLQSASVAPGEEKTPWLSHPFSHWSISWLAPPSFRVATQEKFSHLDQLAEMSPYWDCIDAACIILHGAEDELIYPANALFARNRLRPGNLLDFRLLPNRGHDLLWTQPELLVQSLIKLLKTTRELAQETGR